MSSPRQTGLFLWPPGTAVRADAPPETVARIVKYDAEGNYITHWGGLGSEPGQFRTPHGLAWDSRGRLFVADRGNVRIQIFEGGGALMACPVDHRV